MLSRFTRIPNFMPASRAAAAKTPASVLFSPPSKCSAGKEASPPRTNTSAPNSAAFFASASACGPVKSEGFSPAAKTTGRSLPFHLPRTMCFATKSCMASETPSSSPANVIAASGEEKLSPGKSALSSIKSFTPTKTRVREYPSVSAVSL